MIIKSTIKLWIKRLSLSNWKSNFIMNGK